ncbi:MFS general substrate transporter [Coprinellus micaceus]|uniref:MFS general substrate transporter n=1 Tax=Coprinellus micaceus TaxID=71717 RepID=A0A4Y7T8Q3_COPMI|nr:MFS general substrate transporter [Coprinellus micaceus]
MQTLAPRTRKQIIAGNIQYSALCFCFFISGWNDGSTGPLLPRIQEVYKVSYIIVSLFFVVSCTGFVSGSLANVWLTDRLGFGKVRGAALQIITFSVQASAPPFPCFIAFNFLNGVGFAFQNAQGSGFVGSLTYSKATKMGFLHASYGLGAFTSPLVSTQFAQMNRWSFHYLISLGLVLSNTIIVACVFRFRDLNPCLAEAGERVHSVVAGKESGKFRQIMSERTVHYLAFYALVYVGVEVTIGGWIVTYIIQERNGGPSSGYISSGFFGGLTLGRVVLLPLNKWAGEHRVFYIYAFLSLGLEFVVWFVPSLVGNAITVSFIGMLLGPMYPIAMNRAARILPPWILTGAIGWIGALGQAGSAIVPFMTGAIAEKHSIKSLHPLMVSMMAFMILLFALTPNKPLADSGPLAEGADEKKTSSKELRVGDYMELSLCFHIYFVT